MEVPDTMKAWLYNAYGDAEMFKLDEAAPVPVVSDNHVLVKIVKAALKPVDTKHCTSKFEATDSPLPVGLNLINLIVINKQTVGMISEKPLDGPKQSGSLAEYTAVEKLLLSTSALR
ncbi:unnamed protein product [Urochloa humidicola]